jgi:hypothetical protein
MLKDYISLDGFFISNDVLAELIEYHLAGWLEWETPDDGIRRGDDNCFRGDAAQCGIWDVSPYYEGPTMVLQIQGGEVYAFPNGPLAVQNSRARIVLATIKAKK